MLENLYQVDWARLSHASGAAVNIPLYLRQLASPRRKDREEAYHELSLTLLHKGAVFEATAFAVPFLTELLEQRRVKQKTAILLLLHGMARGHVLPDTPLTLEQWMAGNREPDYAKKTRQAVADALPVYLEFLESSGEEKIMAAALLANFPEHANFIQPYLITAFYRTPAQQNHHWLLRLFSAPPRYKYARAHLLFSIVKTDTGTEANLLLYKEIFEQDKQEALLKLIAAYGLVSIQRLRPPREEMKFLIDVLAPEHPACQQFEEIRLYWEEIHVFDFIYQLLIQLDFSSLHRYLYRLIDVLSTPLPGKAIESCHLLLTSAFRPGAYIEQLNIKQVRVLQLILELEALWNKAENRQRIKELLICFGLPEHKGELEEFIHLKN